ncbi:MAG: hypothetical protein GX647_13360 [Clostridiales bacterium]|nr:hypothetical protein [Clostridiales bacterium]
MKRKCLAILLILCLLLTQFAAAEGGFEPTAAPESAAETPIPEDETPEEPTIPPEPAGDPEAPTEAPAEVPAEEPAEAPAEEPPVLAEGEASLLPAAHGEGPSADGIARPHWTAAIAGRGLYAAVAKE